MPKEQGNAWSRTIISQNASSSRSKPLPIREVRSEETVAFQNPFSPLGGGSVVVYCRSL